MVKNPNHAAFEDVVTDPPKFFERPKHVLTAHGFTRAQKIEMLKRWKDDSVQLMRASEENMAGGEQHQLGEVERVLERLTHGDIG